MIRNAWLALGAVALGCGSAGPAVSVATRVDSSGIEIVANAAEDVQLGWAVERVLSLGGNDSGPESFFRVPAGGVAFDSAGRIHVLDAGNKRVLIFTKTGEFVRSMGREGRGPGEFQFPASLTVEETGIIAVHDFGRRAVMRFDSVGNYIDEVRVPSALVGPVRADHGGYVIAQRQANPTTDAPVMNVYRETSRDTLRIVQVALAESKSVLYKSCGVSISLPPLFENPPDWNVRDNRIALADRQEYSIRMFENGAETRHVRRAIEPEPATRAHAMREVGRGEDWQIGGTRTCTVPPEEVVEQRGISQMIPTIRRVALDPDGWLWVQREVVGEDDGPVDLFDATGQYVGTLPWTTPWPLTFRRSGQFLALETDELDVQHVVLYRLTRADS